MEHSFNFGMLIKLSKKFSSDLQVLENDPI